MRRSDSLLQLLCCFSSLGQCLQVHSTSACPLSSEEGDCVLALACLLSNFSQGFFNLISVWDHIHTGNLKQPPALGYLRVAGKRHHIPTASTKLKFVAQRR